ncbi:hypothetical protein BH23GEM11_BH23GEM11_13200 [soil metagenome]
MTDDSAGTAAGPLLRRQGSRVFPVVSNFDYRAMNEIAFRAGREEVEPAEAFDARMERVREMQLETATDGPVQADAEAALLDQLNERLDRCLSELSPGEVLVIESAPGVDWPKTRERRKDVIVDGENRFHFHWRVEPPLRVAVYRERAG